ncbi:muramidase-released protein [Streptococcus acidominimus]|uniref:Muramidase-released protein n=2 Tax=Streptococcus TaxID=1301 RepID=A0A239WZA0_STRAI|nr:MucBP domain-containing protein [Streptococcus acidominimus]SNV39148.1 muramidase-released protein [Streptococcus acidominimus]
MSKNKRKKSMNWYDLHPRFSIRKYHFGAASVLLGVALALTGGGEVSATTTDTSASTTPSSVVETPSSAMTDTSASTTPSSVVETPSSVVETPSSTTEPTTPMSDASTATSTSETTSSSATEGVTTTTTATERVATIEYTVEYQDESGKAVASTVKSVETKTTDKTAIATVTETATVPAGYELVANDMTTSTTGVVEGANTKVVFKVVKKGAADTASTTTSSSTTDEPATTPATASTVAEPTTVAEAKVILEQNISEAQVLSDEANRLYTASPEGDEALKITADATKLVVTEATAVFENSVATLEQINAQISAVRTNVEALVLELRKYLGTDVIEIALNTSLTSGLKVGEGEGILVEKGTTATPSMDVANGAGIKPHTLRTGVTATTEDGWYTFESYDLYSYNANMEGTIFNGTALKAYVRFSLDSDPSTQTVLAELVSTTDGQVLEKYKVDSDSSVVFTYPKKINPNNENLKVSYETQTAVDGSTFGNFRIIGDATGSIYNNTIIPTYQVNTTTYKVEDGRILALYNLQTIAGQTVTSSGQREFAGYEFVKKIVEPAQGGYPVGMKYVAGVVNTATDKSNTIQYKVIRTVVSNTEYVHEIYVLDPTYTGTVDWDGLDTRGFFKLLETSHMSYTPDKVSYDYNTNPTITANYKVDPDTGYMVFAESPLNDKGSKYRVVAQWSGTGEMGKYGKIFIGSQVWTKANTAADTPFAWQSVNGSYVNLGYSPYGIQQTLRGSSTPAALTTTYVYRALNQEAIIRYQVEGATDYLEDSGILTGGSGTDINYSTEETINEYKKLGYELVSDNFTTSGGQDYDYDTAVLQEFLVVIKPRVVDVPKGVVPRKPVDPTDPNSPIWPDTVNNLETTQEVTRTVEYKYEDGTPVRVDAAGNVLPKGSTEGTPFVKTETVSFTRPAQVNLVTGKVTYGDWVADTTDTLQGNVLPEVPGYSASRTTLEGADAPMTETVKDKTVTATDADINEVVYFKENPKYGDVVVNYVNTDGKVIATPVVDTNDALVGTDYSTADRVPEKIVEDETGDVYYYKEIKAEDAAKETGKVVEGTTEVTYVYEKAGNVVVNYVDTEGNPLIAPVADVTDGKPGSGYDTVLDNKLASISVDGKLYRLVPAGTYNVGTVSTDNNLTAVGNGKATGIDDTTGTVEAGTTKEITYVYEEVKGDVIVEYYDTEGNPIAKTVVDEDDKSVGTVYNTDEDNKPETITTEDGTVYYYKEVKDTSAPTVGKVAETTTTVQYVYEKAGDVIVHYIATDGTPISGVTNAGTVTASTVDDTVNGKPGSTYDTSDLRPTTITTDEGKTYELVPAATKGNENGTVESGVTKEVTYVYQEVKGSVVVNYISTTGEELQAQVVDTPESSTGTEYDTTDVKPETITTKDGRTFKLVPQLTQGSEKGEVVPGVTEVTYVYEEVKGDVVVNYVNTDGKVIATQVVDTKTTSTGTAYDTTDNKPEKIVEDATGDVYYYKEVQAGSNETGKVVEGTTEVTYVYEKAGNVVVNYITEDGTVIKTPVNDETNAKPGSPYDTTDNKPTEIVTEDGSRYVLIPSKTIGTENGTVEGGKTTEITYVYKKVANWVPEIPGVPENERPVIPYPFDPNNPDVPITPTPDTVIPNVPGYTPVDPKDNTPLKPVDPNDPGKGYVPPTPEKPGEDTLIPYVQNGNVVVNYVTEDGTVIKAPVQDETNVPAGKSYDTTDNKPKTITTEDGTTYELVRVDGSENGTVEGGKTTEVTYVYRKVTPAKKVVTNHVDEDGNPIAPQEEGTTPNKSIPGYEFTGKTVTDPDGNTTHIYRKVKKVVTNHVDEDGNPIAPQEEGTTPNKSIPGYEFTGKTVTDPDGNTTHIYRKVKKVVTNHVDEDGNPIAPQEEGTTPNKSIPGYEFTGKTITDKDGNTTHIYRKINNSVKPTPPTTNTPSTPKPNAPMKASGVAQLPNTGESSSSVVTALGAGMLLASLGLVGKRRKDSEE